MKDAMIYPEDMESFGLKFAEEENYDLVGIMVDLKDLDDDPEGVSPIPDGMVLIRGLLVLRLFINHYHVPFSCSPPCL